MLTNGETNRLLKMNIYGVMCVFDQRGFEPHMGLITQLTGFWTLENKISSIFNQKCLFRHSQFDPLFHLCSKRNDSIKSLDRPVKQFTAP